MKLADTIIYRTLDKVPPKETSDKLNEKEFIEKMLPMFANEKTTAGQEVLFHRFASKPLKEGKEYEAMLKKDIGAMFKKKQEERKDHGEEIAIRLHDLVRIEKEYST